MKSCVTWKLISISSMLLFGIFIAFFWSWIPISNRLQWTCAMTGAQKGREVYLGFIPMGDYYRTSGLERLLIDKGHTYISHDWVKTEGTERYILLMTHSHSRAPASYHFNYFFPAFMERASEEQKMHMMRVFLEGPEDARKAFLNEAEKIAFESTEPNAPVNGRQPFSSETNRTSSAAGSRH